MADDWKVMIYVVGCAHTKWKEAVMLDRIPPLGVFQLSATRHALRTDGGTTKAQASVRRQRPLLGLLLAKASSFSSS